MLINNDVASSQTAHRQRRIAADEKVRTERIANETVVREGVVRQAGEAPTREEVSQFRALLQAQGRRNERAPETESKQPAPDMRTSTPAGSAEASKSGGELVASTNTAERFRALLQRAFTPVSSNQDGLAREDRPASLPRETKAPTETSRQTAAPDRAPAADDAAATAERARTAPDVERPRPPGEGVQAVSKDPAAPEEKRNPELKRQADSGDAESAQSLARKAADGETQVGAAARAARSNDESRDGGAMDAGSSQANLGSTPTPVSTDMAASMPPQRMADAAQQAQAATASGNVAPALAELVQKHIRQMLVSDPRSSRGRSREVLLRMQNDVLPGTDLWLTQTDGGWQLRADVRSRDAYDTLLANQDELVQRFADSALGKLSIEPVYHG